MFSIGVSGMYCVVLVKIKSTSLSVLEDVSCFSCSQFSTRKDSGLTDTILVSGCLQIERGCLNRLGFGKTVAHMETGNA